MLKKVTLWILAIVLMVGISVAQEKTDEPMRRPTERAPRGMRRAGPGMQPDRDRFTFMRGGFPEWFNQLAEAHEQNNNEKVGELIAQMKPRMERMQSGMARGDRPTRPERPGMGDRSMGFGPGRPAQGGESSFMQTKTLPKTDIEKKILSVLDDMDKNQRRGMMNVPVEDGRLLRLLTETIGAKHIVEIGTSNGYSGIWFCLALQKTGGKLTTHEIDARRASLARENFKKAGVDKLVTLVEGDAHKTVTNIKEPIDILFLDADKEGYIDYLNKLLPMMREGGLVIAHNISPRQADPNYIKAITTNADLETILYQQGGGVSVTLKKR